MKLRFIYKTVFGLRAEFGKYGASHNLQTMPGIDFFFIFQPDPK